MGRVKLSGFWVKAAYCRGEGDREGLAADGDKLAEGVVCAEVELEGQVRVPSVASA